MSNKSKKCLDFEVLTKTCKACETWKQRKGRKEYEVWKLHHKCTINHFGSSGAMESAGAITIFKRSQNLHKLRYTGYIGDGDSNSYKSVTDSAPYGNTKIEKLECVGHVQKRMGTRLRNLRTMMKGKVLSDGKKLSGKGRLTDKIINTIQNYYGLAIRQNAGQLYQMKKSIAAILFHLSENKNIESRHKFCPRTADSWCKYQSDKITGKDTYKDKVNLPTAIKEVMEPIFKDLSDDSLLKKCLHGQTQNANEALNKMIWQRCPKDTHASFKIVKLASCSAVLYNNDGCRGVVDVLQNLGIQPGSHTLSSMQKVDDRRIINMARKSSEYGRKRRKKLRAIKKGFADQEKLVEGTVYEAGGY